LFALPDIEKATKLVGHPVVRELVSKYRPWRKVSPIARAAGLDPVQAWAAVKFNRFMARQDFPLTSMDGQQFGYSATPTLHELLHRIDHMIGGGRPAIFDHEEGVLSDTDAKARFMIRTLMDEAIESSIIEGAVTTRELAIDLLRSGRQPKTAHEHMVANNYAAMRWIIERLDHDLSPGMLCTLQEILTRNTIPASQAGRFRNADERIGVVDERTGETVFVPPPADQLEARVRAVCAFANAKHSGEGFLHPIIKACTLHFMIGYEHPFVDGNGRTARAVFYWSALRSGYQAFGYLRISELIRKAYAAYPRAYMDTESDDADLTYFILYKLEVILRAIEHLSGYLAEEEAKIKASLRMLKLSKNLNLRQRLLLEHALRHPKTSYTAKSHAASNGITTMTARADLESLRQKRLLNTYKVRREVNYMLAPGVPARLARMDRRH